MVNGGQAFSGMEFRAARPADARPIADLIMAFRDQLAVDPEGRGAETFFASVSATAEEGYIRSDRYDFVVAETGGQLAGCIAMRDRTHLFHLFVAPRFQRRGLARELWRRAQDIANPAGERLEFTVNSSLSAVPVYERLGFVQSSPPERRDGVAYVPMRYEHRGPAD